MPSGAEVLSVGMQHGHLCVWFMVDTERPTEAVVFRICGTGNPITSGPGKFIGTVQQAGGALVWHVFKE